MPLGSEKPAPGGLALGAAVSDGAGPAGQTGQSSETVPDFAKARVLVVEDQVVNQRLLIALLESVGVGSVMLAQNGREALDILESEHPHLVVLDIMMPEVDGLEVLRRLRDNPVWADLPVLVQTALNQSDQRNEIMDAGASDLVTKPLNGPEFCARVRVHLQNRMMMASLRAYQERVAEELSAAMRLQAGLFPTPAEIESLEEAYGISLKARVEMSTELGGDIWTAISQDDNRLCLFTADFSGHGVSAALNTMRLHTMLVQMPPSTNKPGGYLECLNEWLAGVLPIEQFATSFLCTLNAKSGRLHYALAGGPPPIFITADGQADYLSDGSLPLGILKNTTYESHSIDMPPGAALFIFSDCLTEAPARDGGPCLDEDGLLDLVRFSIEQGRDGAFERVMDRFFERTGEAMPDDMTAIWLERPA